MIERIVVLPFLCLCAFVLGGCGDALDDLVEEEWLGDAETSSVPLETWASGIEDWQLDWITKEETVTLARNAKASFGLELGALVEAEDPEWTHSFVGELKSGTDQDALRTVLLNASATHLVEVEIGTKWVLMGAKSDEAGESIRR